jgi:hypothetical protein
MFLASNGRPPLRPPGVFERKDFKGARTEAIRRPAPPPPVPPVSKVAPHESPPREAESRCHRCASCKSTQAHPQPAGWFAVTRYSATGPAEDRGFFCSAKCLMKYSQRLYQLGQAKPQPRPAALENKTKNQPPTEIR